MSLCLTEEGRHVVPHVVLHHAAVINAIKNRYVVVQSSLMSSSWAFGKGGFSEEGTHELMPEGWVGANDMRSYGGKCN